MSKKALGKGLNAIISTISPEDVTEEGINLHENAAGKILELDVDTILPNPDQPRTHFDENKIKELADSIKSTGLIQPVSVRREGDKYFLITGERRLRASKMAGMKKIKAIVVHADEQNNLVMALIENLQREDLDPIEEAKAYKILANRLKLKQQEIAERVGKDRATVANSLRLLNLDERIQQALTEGKISVGHAKVLLSAPEQKQFTMYLEIIKNELSVRDSEKLVVHENKDSMSNGKSKDPHIKQMEGKLVSLLGTKVEIKHFGKSGKIEIYYYSIDDFDRLMELFGKRGK